MTTRASAWVEAVVDEIVPRTPRISSVFLRAPILAHSAGQHLDIRLTAPDGYQAQRSYSIASAPEASRTELLVERLNDGEVSPYLTDVAQPGDTFEVRGPIGGHFVWRHIDGGPVLLVAGGSGIAPLLSITRHWALAHSAQQLHLLYSARTWEELACVDELISLERNTPLFSLTITTTREAARRSTDFARRVDRPMVRDLLDRSTALPRHTYVCGSVGFVDAAAAALTAEGLAPSTIRTERFGGTPPP